MLGSVCKTAHRLPGYLSTQITAKFCEAQKCTTSFFEEIFCTNYLITRLSAYYEMRVVCTMKPQFRESSVQHTLGGWSAENGIHEIHPSKLLCDSGHQLYDILVRGQNQQKVHVPATLLQLCFRDIVHQHSLMAPTSEHTFSSWNERSNLYIGIGKQAYSGLPILKVPCAFGS